MELSAGDVVCKKLGPGLSCSAIAWCSGDRCITSGDYTVGDALYTGSVQSNLKLKQVAVVDKTMPPSEGSPRESTLAFISRCPGVIVNSFKNKNSKNIRPQVNADYETLTANNLQIDAAEPVSGRINRISGWCVSPKRVLPPSPDIIPLKVQGEKLENYHQGSTFRYGNTPVCIFTGFLKTDTDNYAACYSVRSLCKIMPEFCIDRINESANKAK